MSISSPLSAGALSYLRQRAYAPDAARLVCIIPLSGIYWEDELPSIAELMRVAEEDHLHVYCLFAIRYRLWDGKPLTWEDQEFWDAARAQVPGNPIFQRITLSAADKRAHEDASQYCEQAFEELFADADQVTVTDLGSGIQSFSACFDLTKNDPATLNVPTPPKLPWWKRIFSRKR